MTERLVVFCFLKNAKKLNLPQFQEPDKNDDVIGAVAQLSCRLVKLRTFKKANKPA